MRVDAPGGDTVDLHRRCWIGRGGRTPPGAIRVLGGDARLRLGPRSRLPAGHGRVQGWRRSRLPPRRPDAPGARRAGGHDPHRGANRRQRRGSPRRVTGVPSEITNRIFSATIQLGGPNLSMFSGPTVVQPMLVAAGRQVGRVAMAVGAELDATTGTLTLEPGHAGQRRLHADRRRRRIHPPGRARSRD